MSFWISVAELLAITLKVLETFIGHVQLVLKHLFSDLPHVQYKIPILL